MPIGGALIDMRGAQNRRFRERFAEDLQPVGERYGLKPHGTVPAGSPEQLKGRVNRRSPTWPMVERQSSVGLMTTPPSPITIEAMVINRIGVTSCPIIIFSLV